MSFWSGVLPRSSAKSYDGDEDYSFAVEYSGPPLSYDIPRAVPIDFRRIPTASQAAAAASSKNLSIPVVQPIVRSNRAQQKASEELKSGSQVAEPPSLGAQLGKSGSSGGVYSRKLVNGSREGRSLMVTTDQARSSSSSGTLWFSDCHHHDSNNLTESSGADELEVGCKAAVSHNNCLNSTVSPSNESASKSQELSSEISSRRGLEDSVIEASGQRNRTSAVTFVDLSSSDANSGESYCDEPAEMPVVLNDGKKGQCHRCHKKNRFAEREVCIVCCAKYCCKCVIRAMGSMPEGRKCITCIGYGIHESKRGSLGKCSRMLKRLLTNHGVEKIMKFEISFEANQLPPHLICVNEKRLSKEELIRLQSCPIPPKKLRPGKYWYDTLSGFWGKEGEKPCQIISAELSIGHHIRQHASNGDTKITINGREITKAEHKMLQAAGIHCEGNPDFWLSADGSYMLEGMKNVMGNLWLKKRVKIACAVLSLPFPSNNSNSCSKDDEEDTSGVNANNREQRMLNKLLLVGCDQSGTSTIFKQVKIIYSVPFTEDEKQNIKIVIQRNVYSYICILLEGHAHFEEEYLREMKRRLVDEPGPSGIFEQIEESNIYSIKPKLKHFSHWLQQIWTTGKLELIFPATTREYSPLVEELWKDKAFQITYKRRNELPMLPRVANYFLDRAVEIVRADYEPSQMDILYADGIASSNGVASMEFSFPISSHDKYMEASDENILPMRNQLIRVHESCLGQNCKWLEMFEDVNLVIYCVSLTAYDEYYEDINGICKNRMMETKEHFETIVTHPALVEKKFLLILNKFDLLEEKINQVPLSQCDWFQDFNPVISLHPDNAASNNNPSLPQRAFHYVAVKFKRLFSSLSNRKLFVAKVTGLEGDSVDKSLIFGSEILKWGDEIKTVNTTECYTESTEPSTSS